MSDGRPFIPAWFRDAGLSAHQIAVLAIFWSYEGGEGVFPSAKTVAAACRIRRDTAFRAISELERRGLLIRIRQIGTSNSYRLLVPNKDPSPQTVLLESSPKTGLHQSGLEGLHQPRKRGRKGTKGNVPNEGKEGAPVGTPHSLPFDSDAFRDVWALFVKHRIEIRKPLKPTSAAMQLRQLEQMGERRAIRAIEYTIAKGWQGIREPEPGQHVGSSPSSVSPSAAIPEPAAGWRQRFVAMFPNHYLADDSRPWRDLSQDHQRTIIGLLKQPEVA